MQPMHARNVTQDPRNQIAGSPLRSFVVNVVMMLLYILKGELAAMTGLLDCQAFADGTFRSPACSPLVPDFIVISVRLEY